MHISNKYKNPSNNLTQMNKVMRKILDIIHNLIRKSRKVNQSKQNNRFIKHRRLSLHYLFNYKRLFWNKNSLTQRQKMIKKLNRHNRLNRLNKNNRHNKNLPNNTRNHTRKRSLKSLTKLPGNHLPKVQTNKQSAHYLSEPISNELLDVFNT